jgi:hypothetical protein
MSDSNSDLEIKIKTISDGKGVEEAKKGISELNDKSRETAKAMKEAQHAAKLFGSEAAGAAREARGLLKEASAFTSLFGRLGSIGSTLLSGAAFGAGLQIVGSLLEKAAGQIKNILDLLTPTKLELRQVTNSFAEAEEKVARMAEAVKNLAAAYGEGAAKAAELRAKQDELSDAKLQSKLAGIDLLEALGPSRGGITPLTGRIYRASARMDSTREKSSGERAEISEQQKVISAQQAASADRFSVERERQRKQDERREAMLERASKILGVPKEELARQELIKKFGDKHDEGHVSPVFDRIFEQQLREAGPQYSYNEEYGEQLTRPENPARLAELKTIEPLGLLLRSNRTLYKKYAEQSAEMGEVAKQKLPGLEHRSRLVDQREEAGTRSAATELVNIADAGKAGSASVQQIVQTVQQFSQGNAANMKALLDVFNNLASQQRIHDREIQLIQSQLRNDPYR